MTAKERSNSTLVRANRKPLCLERMQPPDLKKIVRRLAGLLPVISILFFVSGVMSPIAAQTWEASPTPFSTEIATSWMRDVLPGAEEFERGENEPPAWAGFRIDPVTRQRELHGYVFHNADLPPMEPGYSEPIDILVGVDTEHQLGGVKILDYNETYLRTMGDFLARTDFLSQFRGKAIWDDFQISRDIDGISGATVSVFAIARGARDKAREVAEAYLGYDPGDPVQTAREARIVDTMSLNSWTEQLASGVVRQLQIPLPDGGDLVLSFTYLGDPGLGAYWIGADKYEHAERGASSSLAGDELLLVSIGGGNASDFRYDQLQVYQEDSRFQTWFRRFTDDSYIDLGTPQSGPLADQAERLGAIVLPRQIDIYRPFILGYRHLGTSDRQTVEFRLTGLGARLAQGEDVLSRAEIEAILEAENNWFNQLRNDPPWGVTPWIKVLILLLILSLAMIAFLLNNAAIRWLTLIVTVAYLGFIDGSFISISHLINTINQGDDFLLSNLPLLLFVIFTLITTLLWGRIFCSSLCPFGAAQDFITRLTPKRWQRQVPQAVHDKALYLKYGILALIIGMALFASNIAIFQYFEPFGTLFFLNGSLILWSILIAILAACFMVPRFYCRYGCPLGAALGVVSLASPLRIKRVPQCTVCVVCEHACPTGAIRQEEIDFKECVRCDICEIKLIEKAGSCRHEMSHIIASTAGSTKAALST